MFPLVYDTDIERHATAAEIGAILAAYRGCAERDGRAPLDVLRDRLSPGIQVHLEIVAPSPDGYRFLQVGPAIVAACGRDLTGRLLADAPAEIARPLTSLFDRVVADGRPLFTVQRSLDARAVRVWDRLVLPARAPEGEDRLLVALLPRVRREDLLDAVLEASCDGIMSLRAVRDRGGEVVDAVIMSANGRACDYAGHPVWRLVDGSLRDLFPGLLGTGFWERCVKVVEERTTERFEINLSHARRDTWLRLTVAPLEDGFVMSFNDITDLQYALFEAEVSRQELAAEIEQRQALEAELRRLSITDDLTGVLNRRGFANAVRAQTAVARRYGHDLALLALDIDHFKHVNDRFGHAAGDTVLMAVAALFVDSARVDIDIVGRVGGEEFMVLLPHTALGGALAFAERLRRSLADTDIAVGGERVRITTSIGLRAFGPGISPEQMLLDADKALYRAKALGRNRTVVFEGADSLAPADPA
ncbi:sensor domain-containing diguanylate cyclase [Salinarimonas soli]|nr:sensor domain-containing diguanylate cyclase [Salinarimonas soli]